MSSDVPETAAAKADAADTPATPMDVIALAQLWADQFQHFTTLGVAGAGGVLILVQAELVASEQRWWLALGFFAFTAIFSTYGQIAVVDEASEGRVPGRKPRVMRGLALACMGGAGGAVLATLV